MLIVHLITKNYTEEEPFHVFKNSVIYDNQSLQARRRYIVSS